MYAFLSFIVTGHCVTHSLNRSIIEFSVNFVFQLCYTSEVRYKCYPSYYMLVVNVATIVVSPFIRVLIVD